MKHSNIQNKIAFALIAGLLSIAAPSQAEEAGFSMENSVRAQIFAELRANVQELYRNSHVLTRAADSRKDARVAVNDSDLALPAHSGTARKNRNANSINQVW